MPEGADRVYELTKRVIKIPFERAKHKEKGQRAG